MTPPADISYIIPLFPLTRNLEYKRSLRVLLVISLVGFVYGNGLVIGDRAKMVHAGVQRLQICDWSQRHDVRGLHGCLESPDPHG